MTLKKENAAPDVVVGAATGQHLCNSEISIPNAAPAGNEKIAVPEAHRYYSRGKVPRAAKSRPPCREIATIPQLLSR